ncbi:sensor histidine kinase [Streptomyces sp. B1866]|uniref:sensor histidine kinase n=1 Tax=Streptomyces sp. B1866 TaxID=3075431 RepID=UPI00288E1E2E|nr:sensor histidine kinase [Streptomyces sp. B1866]MDT3398056.1 sensor histidine kinase [Streptomyces sp. B1866]
MSPSTDRPGRFDGASPVDRFRRYEDAVIDLFRARLRAVNSPLAAHPDVWAQCELQARRIFRDCADSLAAGRSTVSDTHVAEVVDLGGERVRQGVHLTHSVRGAVILFDTVLDRLAECAEDTGVSRHAYTAAVRSLQQGVGRRLEAGSIGYDSYLLARVREVHEQGHRKLAREMHDQIGNSLSLAMRQLEMYQADLSCRQEAVPQHVRAAQAAIVETLAGIRELVTELRRPAVAGCLETALNAFVDSMGDLSVSVKLWVRGLDEWIPDPVSDELFLMVREALRNAFSHAEAGNIVVNIDIAPHEIQTEVIDDGLGFAVAEVRAGGRSNGLTGLHERAELLGGTLHIDSTPGRGTHVTIWIPIKEDQAAPAPQAAQAPPGAPPSRALPVRSVPPVQPVQPVRPVPRETPAGPGAGSADDKAAP